MTTQPERLRQLLSQDTCHIMARTDARGCHESHGKRPGGIKKTAYPPKDIMPFSEVLKRVGFNEYYDMEQRYNNEENL